VLRQRPVEVQRRRRQSTCAQDGVVCDCCDPNDQPGVNGNPFCFEGATCCADGVWRCNNASGQAA